MNIFDQDKAGHYLVGSVVACIAAVVLIQSRYAALAWVGALVASAVVGALKEASDAIQNYQAGRRGQPPPHRVEGADFFATFVGAVPVAAPLLLLTLLAAGIL